MQTETRRRQAVVESRLTPPGYQRVWSSRPWNQ